MDQRIIYLCDYGLSQELIAEIGWSLRKYQYIVIPVTPDLMVNQFRKHQNRFPVISFIQSLSQLSLDLAFKRRYLFHAISNMSLTYIEFTSFYDSTNKYEYSRRNKIQQHPLPLTVEEICSIIRQACDQFYLNNRKWPGGIRAKIPRQEIE